MQYYKLKFTVKYMLQRFKESAAGQTFFHKFRFYNMKLFQAVQLKVASLSFALEVCL